MGLFVFTFQLVKIKSFDKIKTVKLHRSAVQFVDKLNFIFFNIIIFFDFCQTLFITDFFASVESTVFLHYLPSTIIKNYRSNLPEYLKILYPTIFLAYS